LPARIEVINGRPQSADFSKLACRYPLNGRFTRGVMPMTTTVNILVVGDDEETCVYLASLLSAKDWQTDRAWVGSKALELARNNAYDAIVFDYRKPGLDGADVCRRIRETQPSARHVFMTGTPNIDTVYRAVEAGADRVLAKPVEPTELVHVLEEQLAVTK
jgi:DNA-binding response OmpR family regulator